LYAGQIASRIIERAIRIRIALASCCPEAETFSWSRAARFLGVSPVLFGGRCRLFFTRFIKSHQEDNHFARRVLRNFKAAA
jgi:hypothetical protein